MTEPARDRSNSNKYSLRNLSFSGLVGGQSKNGSINVKDAEPHVRFGSVTGSNTQGSGKSTLGKSAIKGMGFKVAKSVKMDPSKKTSIYDIKWSIPNYPETAVDIFETLMKSFGVGAVPMNEGQDDWVGKFMETLHLQLSRNSEQSPLINPSTLKLMKEVIAKSEKLVEDQRRIQMIVKIQAKVRGWLLRRKLKLFVQEEGVKWTQSKMFHCSLAFRDLLKAESDYIKTLDSIVKNYLQPLRRSVESKRRSILPGFLQQVYVSKEDLSSLFSNVEVLLNVHVGINQNLLKLNSRWPFVDNFGSTFLRVAPSLVVYGDYVTNCKNALNTLLRLQETDPKFKAFLQETMEGGAEDLMGLTVRPLNHISHYYVFLKALVKNFPQNHWDMQNLRNAYIAIKKTSQFIQESNQKSANRAKLADVSRKIEPNKTTEDLVSGKRTFVFEGPVTCVEKLLAFSSEKPRFAFALSDLYLITEDTGKGTFRLHYSFLLKDTQIAQDEAACQIILTSGQTRAVLVFKTKEEKANYAKKINELIHNANIDKKVFGVALEKLLEREKPKDGIPLVIKFTTDFIKTKAESEGIFRLSGSPSEVAKIRELLSKLAESLKEPLNLTTFSPYTVAAVLKAFFRELPEPILTFGAYPALMEAAFEDDKAKQLQDIAKAMSAIPKPNQIVMRYLCEFLSQITSLSAKNKMNVSNIAIVFGPNLIYAKDETIESILNIPKLNAIIQIILENYSTLFPPSSEQ